MVGHHLLLALKELNVPEARLRWPNDLMSGRKKLAGLLIEQGGRQKLTVGIGMNVQNAPWTFDPSLADSTTRLADVSGAVPPLDTLTVLVLDRLGDALPCDARWWSRDRHPCAEHALEQLPG